MFHSIFKPLFIIVFCFTYIFAKATDVQTLAIGSKAPDFKLKNVDGKKYKLSSFKKSKILMVVFTCNHCPTAQAYEDRLINIANEYKSKGVQVVAISPNYAEAVRLDELGFSDLNDTYEDMIIRAERKNFPFPYLYDGDKQETAKKYGPIATPHVFIFDNQRILRYQGRIDDVEKPNKTPKMQDARNALNNLLEGKTVDVPTTKVFGCSIKWAEKSLWRQEYEQKWAAEKVAIQSINKTDLIALMKNSSEKLLVINVWATWCGPCVAEFPELIEINRMYRERDFQMITISADDPTAKNKALQFLQKQQASCQNYIFDDEDKYALIDAIDVNWQGAIPYTVIVEPGGKITYTHLGSIDAAILKNKIVESPTIGRFYK